LGGLCSRVYAEKTIKVLGLNSDELKTLNELRHDTVAFEDENVFFSQELADFLRVKFPVGSRTSSPTAISMNQLYIAHADLSNVDFSHFDISDTVFDTTILDGASLTPVKFGTTMDIRFSEWWNVREINQTALEGLITYEYPYYVKDETFPSGAPVDRIQYAERIKALCVPMKPFCRTDKLRFGP
jgi:hypothetical protein